MHDSSLGRTTLRIVALCGVMVAGAPSWGVAETASREKIWDHELKRWLTPEELGHVEIYFTEDEAAKVSFPSSDTIQHSTLQLTPEQKSRVETLIGWKFPETMFSVYIAETEGAIDGYAVVQNTIGKHRPITYMVAVNSEGEVTNFEVLVYRESRGNEIATKRFNYQYQGKTVEDPVRINRDIINITGATMSVRSASAGVKRAMVLVHECYLQHRDPGTTAVMAGNKEKGFFESILGL